MTLSPELVEGSKGNGREEKEMSHTEHAETAEKKLMVFEVNPCEPRGLERSGREKTSLSLTRRRERRE